MSKEPPEGGSLQLGKSEGAASQVRWARRSAGGALALGSEDPLGAVLRGRSGEGQRLPSRGPCPGKGSLLNSWRERGSPRPLLKAGSGRHGAACLWGGGHAQPGRGAPAPQAGLQRLERQLRTVPVDLGQASSHRHKQGQGPLAGGPGCAHRCGMCVTAQPLQGRWRARRLGAVRPARARHPVACAPGLRLPPPGRTWQGPGLPASAGSPARALVHSSGRFSPERRALCSRSQAGRWPHLEGPELREGERGEVGGVRPRSHLFASGAAFPSHNTFCT